MAIQIGVDVGGTFTDITAAVNGELLRAKAYSTKDVTTGICNALEKLCDIAKMPEQELLMQVDKFVLGNTVVTNAIDEEKIAKVGLLVTAGFKDTLRIGRSARGPERNPHDIKQRPDLVNRNDIKEINERVDKNGEILAVANDIQIENAIRELITNGVQAIAVSFLWSFRNTQNEELVASILDQKFPNIPYTLSSRIAPVYREYERTVTTVLDAGVKPIVADHFSILSETLKTKGLKSDLKIMQVDGGFVSVNEALKAPIKMFNSGPVGGIEGARKLGGNIGASKIITGDMGGTSFDAALIINGECRVLPRAEIGTFPTALTAIDIATIGSGGGSVAWVDSRGMLRVGPESVGSTPGPACYGRGGRKPSVTDASVVLGLIDPDYFLAGTIKLDKRAAINAINEEVAKPLGLTVEEAAAGIHRLAIHQMANAVRTLTVNRGFDPREFSLISFGGGGGLFTSQIAKLCNITRVVSPITASVFSAYGLLNADSIFTTVKTFPAEVKGNLDIIEEEFQKLEKSVNDWFIQDNIPIEDQEVIREADMKFIGQIFDATSKIPEKVCNADSESIREKFIKAYEDEFGRGTAWTESPIQFTNLRIKGIGRSKAVHADTSIIDIQSEGNQLHREIYDPMVGERINVPVYRVFNAISSVEGPLIIEEPDTTIYVPEGMSVFRNQEGHYIIDNLKDKNTSMDSTEVAKEALS